MKKKILLGGFNKKQILLLKNTFKSKTMMSLPLRYRSYNLFRRVRSKYFKISNVIPK